MKKILILSLIALGVLACKNSDDDTTQEMEDKSATITLPFVISP